MATKIKITDNKIIVDGHSDNVNDCETATLLCNALSSSKDFQAVKYESGYAEFEKIGSTDNLKFVPAPASVTINWDSHITGVTATFYGGDTVTFINGAETGTAADDGAEYTFNVTLSNGYVIDTVTLSDTSGDMGTLTSQTDNTFGITAGAGGIMQTITLTSKQALNTIDISQTTPTITLATKDTHVSKDIKVTAVTSEKTVTPTTSAQTITPANNTVGLSKVTVNAIQTETASVTPTTAAQSVVPSSGRYLTSVSVRAIQAETKTVNTNGTYIPSSGKFFSSVTVNVPSPALTGNATVTDVAKGKTFYADDAETALTGTLEEWGLPTLSGTWQFNSELNISQYDDPPIPPITEQNINFTSKNVTYGKFLFFEEHDDGLSYTAADGGMPWFSSVFEGGGWTQDGLRTVSFTSEQPVSQAFYDWFTANAVQTSGSSATPTEADFTITTNGTTELTALSDKIVRRSPKIAVNVPSEKPVLTGTATANKVLSGFTFYNTDASVSVTGTIPTYDGSYTVIK